MNFLDHIFRKKVKPINGSARLIKDRLKQAWKGTILTFFMMSIFLQPLDAATRIWNNPATGDWNVPGNWTPGIVPTAADDVVMSNGGTATVTTSDAASTATIATTGGNGTVAVQTGGTLSVGLIFLGSSVGTVGTLSVTGPNANLSGVTSLIVGNVGGSAGNFSITAGGFANPQNLVIGDSATSVGLATIDGASSLEMETSLVVGASGTGTLTISGGGTTSVTQTTSVAQVAGSTGTININNTGSTLITQGVAGGLGTSTLTFNGGTLQAIANNAGFISGLTNVILNPGGGTINSNGFILTIPAPQTLSGGGILTKTGLGTLNLSSANSYTGGTLLTSGTLGLGNNTSLGTGSMTFNGATTSLQAIANGLVLGNAINFTTNGIIDTQTNTLTLTGLIAGGGSLTKIGSGALNITGTASLTGNIIIQGGTIGAGTSPLGSGAIIFNGVGTTLQALSSLAVSNPISLTSAGIVDTQTNTLNLQGTISGASPLTKIGSGILTLSGSNNYTGGTILNAGTVQVTNNASLGVGTLAFNAAGTTLQAATNGLSISNPISLNSSGIVDTLTNTLNLPGTISGAGALTKIGSGILTLSGSNNYSGGTILDAGTVQITNNASLGVGTLTFNAAGTTLQATTDGLSISNPISLNSNGIVDTLTNTLTSTGTILGSGALTKVSAGTLILAGPNSYSGGTVISQQER